MSEGAPAPVAERSRSAAHKASPGRIGILAGGGRLPQMIADGVIARGGSVHVVAIEGEADSGIERLPHTWVNWGQVGRMVSLMRTRADAMVIAGSVRRPDLWKVRPDWGLFVNLPQILGMLKGGDDSVLSRVVRFFEAKGIVVRGAHEVAPDLLVRAGPAGALALDRDARADAELGFAVRTALGPLDAGQAVVTAGGKVLAIEGAEGTDAMLGRVAGLGRAGAERSGVLAKGPKPGQELRVDMPAVGPRTVELAAAAGLAGVAVEAGAVLLLDRAEAIAMADGRGIAVEGLSKAPPTPIAAEKLPLETRLCVGHRVPSPLVGEGQGGGDRRASEVGSPPTSDPSPQGEGESGRGTAGGFIPARSIRAIGGLRPEGGAEIDIDKGLAAVQRLAPYASGKAVVVSRAYILSVAAAEPALAVLERTRALRQWGIGARRRIGVLAYRADASDAGAVDVDALLERAAAAGLAGVAVTGPAAALAAFESAGGLADRHGLFLVTRGEER